MKVSGMKIVEITVRTFMISFILILADEMYSSIREEVVSRYISTVSITRMM